MNSQDKIPDMKNILKNSFEKIEKELQEKGPLVVEDLTKLFSNTDPIIPTTDETILTNALGKLNSTLLEFHSFTITDLEFLMTKIKSSELTTETQFLMMIISALRSSKKRVI